ncbi:MAG: SIGNAL peptide protein [Ignavibacteria bacterium RIFOXYA2_FULL_35_10]|nr:MAG: SIGNAL peptide protein [Ignavibacteria bacterium RIFOXYA2_FULL_35_10]
MIIAQVAKDYDTVLGVWLTGKADAKVQIYKKNNKYYGKIIWLKTPNDEHGKPKVDKENPDENLRKRPILGMEILTDFVYDEDYTWEDGDIYDPKSGSTYSCKMYLSKDYKTLEVRGYIGISLFGRTEIWKRVDEQ